MLLDTDEFGDLVTDQNDSCGLVKPKTLLVLLVERVCLASPWEQIR